MLLNSATMPPEETELLVAIAAARPSGAQDALTSTRSRITRQYAEMLIAREDTHRFILNLIIFCVGIPFPQISEA